METQELTKLELPVDREFENDLIADMRAFMDQEEIKDLNIQDIDTYSIQTKEQANYFVKQICELRERKEEITALADNEIKKTVARMNTWKESQLSALERDEEYMSGLLRVFAEQEIPNLKKGKSIKLPYGSIGFKKQPDKYEYEDEAVLAQLEADPELKAAYVAYKPSPKKAELKKNGTIFEGRLYIDNKVIEGILVTPQEDKFEVK